MSIYLVYLYTRLLKTSFLKGNLYLYIQINIHMRQNIYFSLIVTLMICFSSTNVALAQVGIGNDSPRGLLDVNDNLTGNSSSGLVLPINDDPVSNITSPVEGMIVYDSSVPCLMIYANGQWDCTSTLDQGNSNPIVFNCTTSTTSVFGGKSSSQIVNFYYTGGDGTTTFPSQTSTTVNGLTATATSTTLDSGGGHIEFSVTGIPSIASGTISIPVDLLGISCSIEIDVLSNVILINGSQRYYNLSQKPGGSYFHVQDFNCPGSGSLKFPVATLSLKGDFDPAKYYTLEVEGQSKFYTTRPIPTIDSDEEIPYADLGQPSGVLVPILPGSADANDDPRLEIYISKDAIDQLSPSDPTKVLEFYAGPSTYCDLEANVSRLRPYFTIFGSNDATIGSSKAWTVKDQDGEVIAQGSFFNLGNPNL